MKITTTCKDCVFATKFLGAERQNGCAVGRLEKFIELGYNVEFDGESYHIPRVCNMHRNIDKAIRQDDDFASVEYARQQRERVQPTFGIIINQNDCEREGITKTVESILNLDYPHEKIQVIISVLDPKFPEMYMELVNRMRDVDINSMSVFHLQDSLLQQEYACYSKCIKQSYFTTMTSGDELPQDIFSQIDKILNDELLQIIQFKHKNINIISSLFARQVYHRYNSYAKMIAGIQSEIEGTKFYHSL